MKKIDRKKVQDAFEQLLTILDEARKTNDTTKIEEAAKESLLFISALSGNEIAKWVMSEAQNPLPNMPYMTSNVNKMDISAEIGSSNYVKHGLARLILTLRDVLDAAHMSPDILARDLIEMSREDGSSPSLLSSAKKGRGKKDNRDLKYAAKKRIAYVVYYEAGRQSQDVKETFHQLNRTSKDAIQSDTKTWDRIAAILSPSERKATIDAGRVETCPHPDAGRFQDLWKMAMM